jgi:hypothetical protein
MSYSLLEELRDLRAYCLGLDWVSSAPRDGLDKALTAGTVSANDLAVLIDEELCEVPL